MLVPTMCLVLLQFAGYSLRHALRSALLPICTVFTLGFGGLLAGAVITETVFGWQGTGLLLVRAVQLREPFMLLGLMMVTGTFVVFCNLLADIGYAVLDPRVRLGG